MSYIDIRHRLTFDKLKTGENLSGSEFKLKLITTKLSTE
jgi:hypothetical protein